MAISDEFVSTRNEGGNVIIDVNFDIVTFGLVRHAIRLIVDQSITNLIILEEARKTVFPFFQSSRRNLKIHCHRNISNT